MTRLIDSSRGWLACAQTKGANCQGFPPGRPKQIQAVAGLERFRFLTQRFRISTPSEAHRKIGVAFRNMEPQTFADQVHTDKEKKTDGEHFQCGMTLDEI